MTVQVPMRGGVPVGALDELDPERRVTVMTLRRWCDGPASRAEVWTAAAQALGSDRGRHWLADFERMLGLLASFGRRPLVHHGAGCGCLGADESALAELIAAAGALEREDALLIAMVLVRPDMAPALVEFAGRVGRGLGRMARHEAWKTAPTPGRVTCH
jgi:hypothetical protein